MKALLDFIKEAVNFPATIVGWMTLLLLAATMIPQLNYIPKVIILYILTPFVMGSR